MILGRSTAGCGLWFLGQQGGPVQCMGRSNYISFCCLDLFLLAWVWPC